MTIDEHLRRLRDKIRARGLTTHQVAEAAGVSWYSAKKVLSEDGNPELATIRKVESAIVDPPPPSEAA